MDKNYSIEIIDQIIEIRFHRSPKRVDWLSAFEEMAEKDRYGLRLWDISCGVDILSNMEIAWIADLGKKTFGAYGKAAVVARDDLSFGLARIHDVYREEENFEIRVFRKRHEAFEWLTSTKLKESSAANKECLSISPGT